MAVKNEKFFIGKDMYKKNKFEEHERFLNEYKKELRAIDVIDAFKESLDETPFSDDIAIVMATTLIEAMTIKKLYPLEEFEEFKKGEE